MNACCSSSYKIELSAQAHAKAAHFESSPLLPHLCYGLLGALVESVLAHIHQLFEEQITDLREASAGWLHQGVQYGADVRLDTDLQQFLRLWENHRCGGDREIQKGVTGTKDFYEKPFLWTLKDKWIINK